MTCKTQFSSKTSYDCFRFMADRFILLLECNEGWYGFDCKLQCSGHCKDNAVCSHVSGLCDEGCVVGWKGNSCDKSIHMQII